MNNRTAILLLSLLIGASNTVGLIGAPSYLLSLMNPNAVLLTALAAGSLFYVFQKKVHLKSLKFARFAAIVVALHAAALVSLSASFCPDTVRAIGWSFLSVFGVGVSRWIVTETANLHLDPVRSKPFFAYIPIAYESGMLLALASLKAFGGGLGSVPMIYLGTALSVVVLGFIVLHFCPRKNHEVRYSQKETAAPPLENGTAKALNYGLMAVAATIGAAVLCEEHLVRVVLKEQLGSYGAIQDMMITYRLIGSAVMIAAGFAMGRFLRKRHLSPIALLLGNALALAAMAAACLGTRAFFAFIGFEVVKRILEQVLYAPANGILFSFFTTRIRNHLRAKENFYYFNLPSIALTFLFWRTPSLGVQGQRIFILSLILIFLAANVFALLRFRPVLVKAMYEFIRGAHKTAAILAIQALSFLRPRGYTQGLKEVLESSSKKLLRKNIVLALAHSGRDEAVETIIDAFRSGHEEIQLSAVEALQIAQTHRAIHFMTHILTEKEKALTTRVRMNAARVIAGLCGRSAVPLLLDGLYDEDPRVVANTLETLDLFKDRQLIPYFRQHMDSPFPRVRAQALMGLARFRETRSLFRDKVMEILESPSDEKALASILYVIGSLKDGQFHEMLLRLYRSPLRDKDTVKPGLAWALIKTHRKKEGFELFTELARESNDARHMQGLEHYYTMLPAAVRMDLLEHMVVSNREDREFLRKVGGMLRLSGLAFHEELDHLQFLVDDPEMFSVGKRKTFKTNRTYATPVLREAAR